MTPGTKDAASAQSEIWDGIDHILVRLKVSLITDEMDSIEQNHLASLRIGNRDYQTGPGSLIAKMEALALRVDEELNRLYRAYCEVWTSQGHQKSAAFVRAVHQHAIIPQINARCSTALAGLSPLFRKLLERPFRDKMNRLAQRWKYKLEVEARECEHRERTASRKSDTRSDKQRCGREGEASLAKPSDVAQVVPGQQEPPFVANEDYRSVRFKGVTHTLTRNQAAIVKILYEAYQQGTPSVGKAKLLASVESETSRIQDFFRDSPLWQTLVVSEKRRGTYRLNLSAQQ